METKKVKSKAKKVYLVGEIADDLFEFLGEGIETAGVSNCCTTDVLHNFPCDDDITDDIATASADFESDEHRKPTDAQFTAGAKLALQNRIEGESDNTCNLAFVLSEIQSLSKAALVAAGFVQVGAYNGSDGEISIMAQGLKPVRRTRR